MESRSSAGACAMLKINRRIRLLRQRDFSAFFIRARPVADGTAADDRTVVGAAGVDQGGGDCPLNEKQDKLNLGTVLQFVNAQFEKPCADFGREVGPCQEGVSYRIWRDALFRLTNSLKSARLRQTERFLKAWRNALLGESLAAAV